MILGDGTKTVLYAISLSETSAYIVNIHIRDVADKLKREKLPVCSGHELKQAKTRTHKRNRKKKRRSS